MSNVPKNPLVADEDEPPPLVRWRSWPIADKPLQAIFLMAGLIAVGMVAYRTTNRMHLAVLAAAVLAAALWRFFLPVMYEVNADGVNRWLFGRHRRIPWGEVRHYEVSSTGVLLLPCQRRSAIDVVRGEFVPWGSHRDEVLAQIRYHLEPLEQSLG